VEENVRIVVTGDNRDALKKLNKVEDAVNRLNSATRKVEVKVSGIQEAERQAARLYQALERIESAALSKLPQSLQTVIAYLKAANAGLGEFSKRAITAAAAVGDIGRVPFAPIIKAQSQAIKQFQQMERGLVSLRVEFVRVFDRGSTQPLLDGLNLVRVSVLETRNLLEGRGDFTRPILDGLDLVKVRILEIKGLLGGIGGAGGGGRIPPGTPPNAPRLPQGRDPQGPQGRGFAFDPNTLRGLRQGIGYFRELLETAEIGSDRFRVLEDTIANLNKKLEDAQLQFQKATTRATPGSIAALREDIAAKEAAFNQTKRGTREFKELADELRRLNTELSKTERFIEGRTKGRAGRVGTALQSAALGGGFPLLFGGANFSAAGGALGGFAGGLVGQGAGFAGGIVGSALGSAVDTFVEKARDLGRALRDPTENIDALVDALGTTGAATRGLITQLQALGLEEVAAATATELLNAELATFGVDADKFKNETAELDNAVKDLQLVFTALATQLVPVLNRITQIISGFVGTNIQRGTASVSGFSAADAVQGSVDATLAVKRAEEARNEILSRNIFLEKQITSIKQQSNKITASQRAELQFFVDLQKNSLDLIKLQLRYDNERNAAKKELLKNEILITLEKRKQIAADRAAAAERSITERVAALNEAQARKSAIEAQTAQIKSNTENLSLSALQRIPKQVEAIVQKTAADIDVLEAKIQNVQQDTTLVAEQRAIQEATLRAQIAQLRAQRDLQINQLELLEKRLKAEQDLATLVTSTQQRLQIAQAQGATTRAQLQLASPFGGDTYERQIQLLDQLNERQALAVQQAQQIATLEAQKTREGADVAAIDREIQQQQVVNEQLNTEILNRQELERQILRQQQALEKLQPVVDGLTAGFTELFTSTINGSKSAQEVVADTFRQIGEAYINMAAKIIAEQVAMIINERVLAAFRGATGTGGGGLGSIFGSLFGGQYADGGRPPVGKASLVGERGPELFVPNRSGTIIPNDQLGGSSNTVTVNVDAKGTEVSGNSDQSRQLGAAISRAVQAELVKQQRPGGVLHSSR